MKILNSSAAALLLFSSITSMADGAKPNADEIMKKVRDRKAPESAYAHVQLLIKKGDATVEKVFKTWSLKISDDESHSLIEFEKPNTTRILAHSRKSGTDDRWIKTSSGAAKRISGGGGDQSFVQSHFNYSDLEFARSANFKYEMICDAGKCESDYKGTPHYKVKATPDKAEGEIAYLVNLVGIADYSPDKVEYYSKDNKLLKELTIDEVKEVNGFKTPTQVTIKVSDSGDSSILKMTEVDLNTKKVTKQMFDKNLL